MNLDVWKAKLQELVDGAPAYLSQVNSTAVLAALVGGWIAGWIWYGIAGNIWKASVGEIRGGAFSPRRQIFGGIAQVIMTIMLAWFMQKLGNMNMAGGIQTAALLWFGFVMTTVLVNYANLGKRLSLTFIDAIHWLLVLAVMGAIIGLCTELGIGTSQAAAPQPAAGSTTTTGSGG